MGGNPTGEALHSSLKSEPKCFVIDKKPHFPELELMLPRTTLSPKGPLTPYQGIFDVIDFVTIFLLP